MIWHTLGSSFRHIFVFCFLFVLALALRSVGAQSSCISIISPPNNGIVQPSSQASIKFSDLCSGAWYECWYVDGTGQGCSTPNPEQFTWLAPASGTHSILIKSYNQANALLGSATISLIVGMPQTLSISNPAKGAVVSFFPQTVTDTDSSSKCGGPAWDE